MKFTLALLFLSAVFTAAVSDVPTDQAIEDEALSPLMEIVNDD